MPPKAKSIDMQPKIVGYLVQKNENVKSHCDSKEGHMGQVKDLMYSKVCVKSKNRIVYNKCIHNVESVNWRADWSKFCNRSYAQVVKQNTQPRLEPQNTQRSCHIPQRSVRPKVFSLGAKPTLIRIGSLKVGVTNPVHHQRPI